MKYLALTAVFWGAFVLTPCDAISGDKAGNGGDVATCKPSAANSFAGNYMADYLLTYRLSNRNKDVVQVTSWEESRDRVLKLLRDRAPRIAESFEAFSSLIENESNPLAPRVWEPAAFGLIYLDDQALRNNVPRNCYSLHADGRVGLTQAVIRTVVNGRIRYLYDYPIVARLKKERPLQYSFLMIHEWLWDLTQDVQGIRRLNRFLHSTGLEAMSSTEFREYLKEYSISSERFHVSPREIPAGAEFQWLLKPRFDELACSSTEKCFGKLIPARSGTKWGFIDQSGRFAIRPRFDEVRRFSNDLAAVKVSSGLWGYIGETGDFKIQPQFKSAYDCKYGMCPVETQSHKAVSTYYTPDDFVPINAYVDLSGRKLFEFQGCVGTFDSAEGLAAVQVDQDGLFGYVDRTGRVVIRPRFKVACGFSEGLARAAEETSSKSWNEGWIDSAGRMVLRLRPGDKTSNSCEYSSFKEGLVPVHSDRKWGFIDHSGEFAITPAFDSVEMFSQGLAMVRGVLYSKSFIDRSGAVAFKGAFLDAKNFGGAGLTVAQVPDFEAYHDMPGWGVIDHNGNYIVYPQFDSMTVPDKDAVSLVTFEGKAGMIQIQGRARR